MIDISIYKDSDKDDQDFFKLEHVSTLSHPLSLKPLSIHDNNQSIGNTNDYLLDPFDDNSDTENTNGFRVKSSNASVWSVEEDEDWGDLEIPCSQTLNWIPKHHSTLPFSSLSTQLKNIDNSNRNTFFSASHSDDDEDFEQGFHFDSKENTIIQFPISNHGPLHSLADKFEKVDPKIHQDNDTFQKQSLNLRLDSSLSSSTIIVPQSMEPEKTDLVSFIVSESHTPFETVDDMIHDDHVDVNDDDHVDVNDDDHVDMINDDHVDMINDDRVDVIKDDRVDMIKDDHVDMIKDDHVDMINDNHVDMNNDDRVDVINDNHVDMNNDDRVDMNDNVRIDENRIHTAEFDNVKVNTIEMNNDGHENDGMKKKPLLITLDMMNAVNQTVSLPLQSSLSFDSFDDLDEKNVNDLDLDDRQKQGSKCGSNENDGMKKKPTLITLDMMKEMNQTVSLPLKSTLSFDSFDDLDEKNANDLDLDNQQKQGSKCGSNENDGMKKKPTLITLDMMNAMNQTVSLPLKSTLSFDSFDDLDEKNVNDLELDNREKQGSICRSNENDGMKKKPTLITLDMMNAVNQTVSLPLQSTLSFDSFDDLDEKNANDLDLDNQQKQGSKCGSNENDGMKKKPTLITLDMMNAMNQKMPTRPAATLVQQKSNSTLTTKTPKATTISKKQNHKTSEDLSKKDTKKKSSALIKSSTISITNGTPNATLKSINPTPPPRNLSRQSSTEEIDKRKAWVSYSKASSTKPAPRLSLSNEKMSLKQHPIIKSKGTSSLSNSREDLRKPPINSYPNSSDKPGTIHSGTLHSTKVFVKRPTTSTLIKQGFNDTLLSRPHSVLSASSVTNPCGPPERWSSGSTRDMKRPPTHRVAFGRTLKDTPPPCQPQIKPKIRKQPTLIRNLGTSQTPKGDHDTFKVKKTNTIVVVGSMVYDPIAKKWTGNEQSLQIFEKMGKPVKKPTLIPHQPVKSGNGNGGAEKIGGMVFDPVNCVWMGNEEEEDAHLFDEIDAFENNHSSKTAAKMGLLCNKALRDDWNKSETRHKLLIGSWYPRACDSRFIRDSSRTYLWEIKTALLQR